MALIVGSSDYVGPKVVPSALFPALLFLAFWYAQAALMFLRFRDQGRSIEEINRALDTPASVVPDPVRVPAQ